MTKKNHNHIDNVLLKLRRKYSKDEVVAGLNRMLSDKDIEIGGLKAELQHKHYEIKEMEKQLRKDKNNSETIKKLHQKVTLFSQYEEIVDRAEGDIKNVHKIFKRYDSLIRKKDVEIRNQRNTINLLRNMLDKQIINKHEKSN